MNLHHVQARVLISFTNSLLDFRRSPKPLLCGNFLGVWKYFGVISCASLREQTVTETFKCPTLLIRPGEMWRHWHWFYFLLYNCLDYSILLYVVCQGKNQQGIIIVIKDHWVSSYRCQGFHFEQGSVQIEWLSGRFCLPGLSNVFLIKNVTSKPLAYLWKPVDLLLKMWN